MKHNVKVTLILLMLFVGAQLIGLYVTSVYAPKVFVTYNNTDGSYTNQTVYNLPYGLSPPEQVEPTMSVISIVMSIFIAVVILFLLMKLKAEIFLRIWFFVVVILGIAISLNAFFHTVMYASFIAVLMALPLAYWKVFQRNMYVHNFTELLIYPGIASVFIPLLSIPSVIVLLIIISLYDIYAVWHAGFMQKMAKYQIEKIRVFSGFFIPYMDAKTRALVARAKSLKAKNKKVRVHLAILGGGDIVFPIIAAGIVLLTWGLLPALLVSLGATVALAYLFYISEKGKFYPAMPFITIGCLIGLGLAYLIH